LIKKMLAGAEGSCEHFLFQIGNEQFSILARTPKACAEASAQCKPADWRCYRGKKPFPDEN